jgi:hypothetical protein
MNAFLAGERVILRSLETDDLDVFWRWFADREVVRYSLGTWIFPWSKGVVEKDTEQLIGYAGITSVSRINRSGEYGGRV